MPPADRVLGYGDIAEITQKSRRTIRRWFLEGRLRRVRFAGVVGCWESELIAALGWQGSGNLVVGHDADRPESADDVLDALLDDADAELG